VADDLSDDMGWRFKIDFSDAKFSRGGRVDFSDAKFSRGGRVHFSFAVFSGDPVSFFGAEFSGGTVSFTLAEFAGGTVDSSDAGDWSVPPAFPWTGTPPPGVKLPQK
jgi:hypothetical protein